MNVIIVEDEQSAIKNIQVLLQEIEPTIKIAATFQSIEETVNWLKANNNPTFGIFDIQLSDGNSFEIFKQIEVEFPIIFTTAFDNYAIQAFKVNSIDYLLKPINKTELKQAIEKLSKQIANKASNLGNLQSMLKDLQKTQNKAYRKTLLIQLIDGFIPIETLQFLLFFIENGIVYGITESEKKYQIGFKMDELENELNPSDFTRINRQIIISRNNISTVKNYFNSRLLIKPKVNFNQEIIIPKAKVKLFKEWLSK